MAAARRDEKDGFVLVQGTEPGLHVFYAGSYTHVETGDGQWAITAETVPRAEDARLYRKDQEADLAAMALNASSGGGPLWQVRPLADYLSSSPPGD